MTVLERMQLRIPEETNAAVLQDCILSAEAAILARRFPFGGMPDAMTAYLERMQDLVYRCAVDLYNKTGAEGEKAHTENGISRSYESAWISEQLLSEVVPLVGVIR